MKLSERSSAGNGPGLIEAGGAIRAGLRAARDRALVHDVAGRSRTGHELYDRIAGLAGVIAARGVAGRRVGLWYQNSLAALEAYLAVEWVGATRVPVDPGAAPSEAMSVFDAAGVDLVLTDAGRAPLLGGDVLVHDDDQPLTGTPPEPALVSSDTVLHLFPRGVEAGRLRSVPVTYGNWEARVRATEALYRRGDLGPPLRPGDVFMTAQQIMHGTGTIGTFPFLRMGMTQVILDRFDADAALDAVLRHGVTTTFFVPTMVTRLARARDRPPLPLRRLLYGGAPFPDAELLEAVGAFGDCLVQLYGHWAGAWPISILSGGDHLKILREHDQIIRSCGRPVTGVETALRPVPGAGDARELCVRGDVVVREFADPDGWFGLGDIASLDDRGYLHLHGRLDGLINTGGYHVYPREIEEALLALPGVIAAKVVGEPDPTWGQAVTAYIVPAPATRPDEHQLRGSLRERLAAYKVPKRIHPVDQLPPTGALRAAQHHNAPG